jgi:hypothetical protein
LATVIPYYDSVDGVISIKKKKVLHKEMPPRDILFGGRSKVV